MFTQRNRFREGVAALLMTCPAWAAPPEVLISNKATLGVSFGILTVLLVVLGILELKAMRERNSELAIDRLAAAAAQRKAKVNTDSVAMLNEELQNIPDTPARPAMPPPPPPPGGAMPPPPPPPSGGMAPPPPPPPTRAVPTFSAEPEGGEPPTRIMSVPPPPPPPAAPIIKEESLGNTSGSWADMLQKVRANEGDARPKSSAQDSKGSTGSGAWEALLKKASSGASSGEGASPFGKTSSDLPTPPPLPKEDDSISPDPSKKPGRTISLDFGSGGNPFQKPE